MNVHHISTTRRRGHLDNRPILWSIVLGLASWVALWAVVEAVKAVLAVWL